MITLQLVPSMQQLVLQSVLGRPGRAADASQSGALSQMIRLLPH